MSEIEEKSRDGRLYPTVTIILLGMVVLAVLCLLKAMEPIVPKVNEIHTEINASDGVPCDSMELVGLPQRLDSIQNDLESIRDQYQMDINIGIDRLNSWVGFWLTIAGAVLLLGGVWQYMQVKHHDDEWKDLKSEYKSKIGEIENLKLVRDKLRIETTLFNLLRTMTALHDPLMLPRSDERKQRIVEYLDKALGLLLQYQNLKQNETDAKLYNENDAMILCLIYTNFRLNICRCLALFTSPSVSLASKLFLDYVEVEEDRIRTKFSNPNNSLQGFIKELGKLLNCLKTER